MTFAHSKNSRVFVNAAHQSAHVSGYSVSHSREYSPVTSLLDDGGRYQPGLLGGALTVKGMFDSTAGSLHQVVQAAADTDNGLLWTICPDGTALGSPAVSCVSDLADYAVDASVSDTVGLQITAQPDDGVDIGVVLHAHGAETADGNGSSVDNAASSANGGVATLHVTAYDSFDTVDVTVEHSANNSTWATLATFATATDVTYERVIVAPGTTVNRYLRAVVDVDGTGSVTYLVAFARR